MTHGCGKQFGDCLRELGKGWVEVGKSGKSVDNQNSIKIKYNVWLPLIQPQLGTSPETQACALTGNETSNLWFTDRHSVCWAMPGRVLFRSCMQVVSDFFYFKKSHYCLIYTSHWEVSYSSWLISSSTEKHFVMTTTLVTLSPVMVSKIFLQILLEFLRRKQFLQSSLS